MPLQHFHVIGVSRETVDARIIGMVAATPDALDELAQRCHVAGNACVMLATCHRVELYWIGNDTPAVAFRAWVHDRCGSLATGHLEERHGEDALAHLFAVASGLRAQRIGEPEILGQLRKAWIGARNAGRTSLALDALVQRAILASRQVRRKAGFADREASLGDASIALLSRELGNAEWQSQHVLVIGSGVAAASALDALQRVRPASTTVISRTDSRAAALSIAYNAAAMPWSLTNSALQQSDVAIFATRTVAPVIAAQQVQAVLGARNARAVWLDLGVPPNVDPRTAHERLVHRTLADLPSAAHADASAIAHDALQEELSRFAAERHRRAHASAHFTLQSPLSTHHSPRSFEIAPGVALQQ